ncbi:FecR family protein [Candidatus Nitrotoga sp. HW29]|uniref:FecR domain-containing protein n=1 Tax=Candidatus Nitrotoga sp. HW29 TaxID=2886963 RepID=UPI001EF28C94|nr:FecR family protein [Candidatus Nitrotoga sp. HW29]CAH1903791.1 FecR family protein [Candidatus Nitrotoga sp. HW29]
MASKNTISSAAMLKQAPAFAEDGLPFNTHVAQQASEWLVLLISGTATDEDRHAWEQWRNADPEHGRAWRHIENINQRLHGIPTDIVLKTLAPNALRNRRRFIKALTVVLLASGTGLLVRQETPWRAWTADYRTGTGEQRKLTLIDGTLIVLNTTSAIDVDYSDTLRLIQLRTGEMFITTAQDKPTATLMRPFVVETAEGTVRALGTRFVIRQEDDRSHVAVYEGAVEITPFDARDQKIVVPAGQALSFTRHTRDTFLPADENAIAWTDGMIVAEKIRLGDFIDSLRRYRNGYLICDPAAANLLVSGVFPLKDTDSVLASLTDSLPVSIHYRTRFWATVVHK